MAALSGEDSLKVIVFADSHGSSEEMELVLRLEKPEVCLHLGNDAEDILGLRRAFPETRFDAVRGNGDSSGAQEELFTVLGKMRVLMTHGHRYGVKQTLLRAEYAARERGADILLFGHTHAPLLTYSGTLTLMNPGTVSGVYSGLFTYGLIDIGDGARCFIENVSKARVQKRGL